MFTVKDLQDVELLLGLKELEVQRDVVALLYADHPRAYLLVGVIFREARTQDHAGGVEQHLVVGASHWKEDDHVEQFGFATNNSIYSCYSF